MKIRVKWGMFVKVWALLLTAVFLFNSPLALAQSEDERREGFYRHNEKNREFDREREAGLKAYLKEQADWEEQRRKDTAADKKRKKQESPQEDGPEYKADRETKYEDYLEYESKRKAYVKEKKSFEAKNASEQAKRNAWAMEEYGLDKERPRFDIAKRNMYGGKGGSSSPGVGGSSSGSSPSFPPPPVFDDFSDGYVPPPFPPAEPFEQPPEGFPPPPPPMPVPGAPEGGADFEGGYFPPPPPPIPAPEDGF